MKHGGDDDAMPQIRLEGDWSKERYMLRDIQGSLSFIHTHVQTSDNSHFKGPERAMISFRNAPCPPCPCRPVSGSTGEVSARGHTDKGWWILSVQGVGWWKPF